MIFVDFISVPALLFVPTVSTVPAESASSCPGRGLYDSFRLTVDCNTIQLVFVRIHPKSNDTPRPHNIRTLMTYVMFERIKFALSSRGNAART